MSCSDIRHGTYLRVCSLLSNMRRYSIERSNEGEKISCRVLGWGDPFWEIKYCWNLFSIWKMKTKMQTRLCYNPIQCGSESKTEILTSELISSFRREVPNHFTVNLHFRKLSLQPFGDKTLLKPSTSFSSPLSLP